MNRHGEADGFELDHLGNRVEPIFGGAIGGLAEHFAFVGEGQAVTAVSNHHVNFIRGHQNAAAKAKQAARPVCLGAQNGHAGVDVAQGTFGGGHIGQAPRFCLSGLTGFLYRWLGLLLSHRISCVSILRPSSARRQEDHNCVKLEKNEIGGVICLYDKSRKKFQIWGLCVLLW